MVPALVLTTMVALATSAPLGTSPAGAGQARRMIQLNPPPAPGPKVDWATVQQNTRRFEQAQAHEQALRARTDFTSEAGDLLRDAARRAGPAPGLWERFGYPAEPTPGQRASLQRAATEVDEAAGLLRLGAQRARTRLEAVEQSLAGKPDHEAALARLREQQHLLEQRSARVSELAPRIGAGLETRVGGAWERLGYLFQQLFRDDAETRLDGLMAELRSWGDLREPEVLGAALTYVRGELSQAALPQGQVTPAYQSADSTSGSLALEDSTAGKEVELSDEVQAKATQLGSAKATYEYVKNQLKLDWYAGCQKGSTETLREGRGNDVDLAGLLIALLRAQGTPARYVQGTIVLPLAKVADLMGLLSASEQGTALSADKRNLVLNALSAAGIAYEPVVTGGQVTSVKLQHTWVEAYLPYGDYRGIGSGKAGKQWVPIEPSITGGAKYLASTPSADAFQAAGGDAATITDAYLAAPTTNSPLEAYRARVQAGLPSGTTYSQTLRTVTQQAEALDLIPGSLPYAVQSVQGEYAFLPDASKHQLHLVAKDAQGTLLDLTLPLHQVTGHRAVFSFKPATELDAELIDQAGGVYQAPASAVQVLLLARVDGQEKAVATRSVGLGETFDWTLELLLPNGSKKTIDNHAIAGNLIALGVGGPKNGFVEPAQQADSDLDGEAARFVYGRAVAYANAWTDAEEELAQSLGVVPVRPTANVVFVENQLTVDTVAGVPDRVEWKGLEVDADLRTLVPLELQAGRGKALLRLSGYQGSFLESKTLTDGTQADAVSAVTVLQTAAARGLPVLTVTRANAPALLPTLSATAEVLADVRDQVARGREVRIPQGQLAIQNWTGTGYIARDPQTEEGGYFLSGVVSGAQTVVSPSNWTDAQLEQELSSAADRATTDLTQIARIIPLSDTDLQEALVGTRAAKPLAVAVTTSGGLPVANASVTFKRAGRASPGVGSPSSASTTVFTDDRGVAKAYAFPDLVIADGALSRSVEGKPYPQLIGLNQITAEVTPAPSRGTSPPTIRLAFPFIVLGLPDVPAHVDMQSLAPGGSPNLVAELTDGIVGIQFSSNILARVADRYGNLLANQDVVWTATPRDGFFVDPNKASIGGPLLWGKTNPAMVASLTEQSSTIGLVHTGFVPGPNPTTYQLTATARTASGSIRATTVDPGGQFTFQPFIPSGTDLDGIFGTSFPAPVGGTIFRRLNLGSGAPVWRAITPTEPDVKSALVRMVVAEADGGKVLDFETLRVAGEYDAGPPDGGPSDGGPTDGGSDGDRDGGVDAGGDAGSDAFVIGSTAYFWPRYLYRDPAEAAAQGSGDIGSALTYGPRNQVVVLYSLLDARFDGGTYASADPSYSVSEVTFAYEFSGVPRVRVQRETMTGDLVAGDQCGVALASDYRVHVLIDNPGANPAAVSFEQRPTLQGEPLVAVPPPDIAPRLSSGDPDAGLDPIYLLGHARSIVPLTLVPHTSGGTVVAHLYGIDPRKGLIEVDSVPIRISAGGATVGDDDLLARLILPVRTLRSGQVDGGSGSEDDPIVDPARMDLCVPQAGSVEVRSGGLLIAQGHVTVDTSGSYQVTATNPAVAAPDTTPAGTLQVSVPPGDLSGQIVAVTFTPDADPSHPKVTQKLLRTRLVDSGAAPVGHTFVKDVSVADGHLFKQFEDLKVPGRNGGLELSRSYNSRGFDTSPLGVGWGHNYRSYVIPERGTGRNRYLVVGGEGGGQAFDCTGGTGCKPQRGYHGTFQVVDTGDEAGGAVYRSKSGVEYHYGKLDGSFSPPRHPLVRIVDTVGNQTQLEYGGPFTDHEVTRVTEPGGMRFLQFKYDRPAKATHAHLVSISLMVEPPGTSPSSQTPPATAVCLAYDYDLYENLAHVRRFEGDCPVDGSPPKEPLRVEQYQYQDSPVAELHNNMLSYVDPNGAETHYTYYTDEDVLPGEVGFTRFGDKRERIKLVTEVGAGRLPSGGGPAPDAVTRFVYSLELSPKQMFGQTAKLASTQVFDARQDITTPTTYWMDLYGAVGMTERPLSSTVSAVSTELWDPVHQRRTVEQDPRGRVTKYAYDDLGNLIERRVMNAGALPASGDGPATQPLAGPDGLVLGADVVERWAYEPGFSAPTCHVDPEGRVTTYQVDSDGSDPRVKQPVGTGLRLSTTQLPLVLGPSAVAALPDCMKLARQAGNASDGIVTQSQYCGVNKVCSMSNAQPGDLAATIDANGNTRQVSGYDTYGSPTGSVLTPGPRLGGPTVTANTRYDQRGRLIHEDDQPFGHASDRAYDGLDRVSALMRRNTKAAGHAIPTGQLQCTDYYPAGQVRTARTVQLSDWGADVQAACAQGTILLARTTTLDAYNRPVQVVETGAGLPSDGLVSRMEYDEDGNKVAAVDRRGARTETSYDWLNRPVLVQAKVGSASAFSAQNGLDLGPVGQAGTIATYGYDLVGNKVLETDLHGHRTDYTLDLLYRVVGTLSPQVPGPSLTSAPLRYPTARAYDLSGNKTLEADGNGHTTTTEYDFASRVTKVTDPASRVEERRYDANGNLILQTLRGAEGKPAYLTRQLGPYDDLNRSTGTTEDGSDPVGGTLHYTTATRYDDDQHQVVARDRRGFVTLQKLDDLDRPFHSEVDAADDLLRSPDVAGAGGPLTLTSEQEYDALGLRSAVVDPLGRRTEEDHDGLGRLLARRLPMDVSESFVYDGEGHAIQQTDRRHLVHHAWFDLLGRPAQEALDEAISSSEQVVLAHRTYQDVPDASGLVTTIEYDANLNPTAHLTDGLHREVETHDALGEVSLVRYDALLKRQAQDHKVYRTEWDYDGANRPTAQRDFDLVGTQPVYTQSTGYDDLARTQTTTDRGGISTLAELDGLGRTVRSTRTSPTRQQPDGTVVPRPANEVQVTKSRFDGNGNATDTTDANGHVTHSVFDGANRKLSEDRGYQTPEHEFASYTYDAVGNQTSIAHQRIAVPDLTQTYDDLNRVVRSVDALGHVTTRAFDEAGNKLCELKPLGGDPLASGAAGQSVTHLRDTVCAAISYLTQYAYDEEGQVIEVTDALGGAYSFRYDKQRNLLSKQDANNNLTTYEYDALNRRFAEHQHLDSHLRLPLGHAAVPLAEIDTDPVFGIGTLDYGTSYDANGNPDFSTDPKGQHVRSTYGLLNRLANQDFILANGQTASYPATSGIAYTYFPNGVLESVTEHKQLSASLGLDEVTSRTYDGLDRLQTETRTYGGAGGAAKTLSYAYDPKGNRTLVTDSDGVSTHYTFDSIDRISTATLDGVTQPTSYAYYPDGLLKSEAQSNGIVETRSYDFASRLVDITTQHGGNTVSRYVYGYDPNGNRQTLLETRTKPATQNLFTETTVYDYDGLDRLNRVTYSDKLAFYTPDAVGNRLVEMEVDAASGSVIHSVTATFNRADWLLSRTDSVDASASASFGYDLNGNLTGKLTSSLSREIAWDVRDTVSTVTDNNVTVGAYDYNWQKQRTKRDTASEHVEYVLDDKFVLQEARSDQSGHPSYRRYHYAMAQLAVVDSGMLSFISTDAQGSTSDITSTSGSVTKAEQYDAWGKNRNGTAPTASEPKLGYTGHQFDPETGLIYARARYYDSDLGMFLSRDPREAPIGEAPWLNRYVYVKDNPLLYIDIDGLDTLQGGLNAELAARKRYLEKLSPRQRMLADRDEKLAQMKSDANWEETYSHAPATEQMIYDFSEASGGNDMARGVTGATERNEELSLWDRTKAFVGGAFTASQWAEGGLSLGRMGKALAKTGARTVAKEAVAVEGKAAGTALVDTADVAPRPAQALESKSASLGSDSGDLVKGTKTEIVKGLRGKTPEADKVADLIEQKQVKLKIKPQERIEKDFLAQTGEQLNGRAFTVSDDIYVGSDATGRGAGQVHLGDVLHEGVHQSDYMSEVPTGKLNFAPGRKVLEGGQWIEVGGELRQRALEIRALRAEENLRKVMGMPPLFESDFALRRFVVQNYSPVLK